MIDFVDLVRLEAELQRVYNEGYADGKRDAASPWHKVEESPKEDGKYVAINVKTKWWYEASYENRNWKAVDLFGQRWVVIHPTHWMSVELPKEDADADK